MRDQVVIAPKLFTGDASTRGELDRQVRAHLEASLARLGTDHGNRTNVDIAELDSLD